MIVIYSASVQNYNISRCFFQSWNFHFLDCRRAEREKNGPKWKNILLVSFCISGTVNHMIVIFGAHVWNDDIFSNFFHFSIFWFWGFYGGIRAKDDLKLPASVCFALYLKNCRSCRSYNQDLDNDIYRFFFLFFFKYNIVNTNFFLLTYFNRFFNNFLFLKFINKCQRNIFKCGPPSLHEWDFFFSYFHHFKILLDPRPWPKGSYKMESVRLSIHQFFRLYVSFLRIG